MIKSIFRSSEYLKNYLTKNLPRYFQICSERYKLNIINVVGIILLLIPAIFFSSIILLSFQRNIFVDNIVGIDDVTENSNADEDNDNNNVLWEADSFVDDKAGAGDISKNLDTCSGEVLCTRDINIESNLYDLDSTDVSSNVDSYNYYLGADNSGNYNPLSSEMSECLDKFLRDEVFADAFLCIKNANIYAEINVGDANDINKSLIIRDNGASWDTDTNVVITGHRVNLSQPNSKTLLDLDKVHLEDNIIIVKGLKGFYDYSDKKEVILYVYNVALLDEVLPEDIAIEGIVSSYLYTGGGIYTQSNPSITIYTCTPLWVFNKRLVVFGIQEKRYHLLL